MWLYRHGNKKMDVEMSRLGWIRVDEVMRLPLSRRRTRDELERAVAMDSKGRLELSPDKEMLRAAQGHTLAIEDDAFEHITRSSEWRSRLFHGTSEDAWKQIKTTGLSRMDRQHVHMSQTREGIRHESEVVICIDMDRVLEQCGTLLKATNGVI